MKPHLQRLATAGNTGALMLLMFVLVNAPVLCGGDLPAEAPASAWSEAWQSAPPTAVAQRVLFVVVDGLRADDATNTPLMPQLTRFADEGGRGLARLESLIPSTVAAIQTFVTAAVAPPASFLHDFRAPPAFAGGLFAAMTASGRQSFVAGPSLWTDLYGRWIANAATTDMSGKGDEIILQAGVAALQQPLYSFIVVHFGSVDDAGHRHGVHAPTYAQAVAWCDGALSQLLAHVGRHTAVLIVADHGATANGGHAGPELIVRDTPLVTWGPGMPRGALGTLRQRDVPNLVLQAMGLAPILPSPPAPISPWSRGTFAVVAAVTMACGMLIWTALAQGAAMRYEATLCNSVVWIGLLLLLLRWYWGAALLIILTLCFTARHGPARGSSAFWHVLGYSTLFGGLRLADGLLVSQCMPGHDASGWSGAGCSMRLLSGGAIVLAGLAPVLTLLANSLTVPAIRDGRGQAQTGQARCVRAPALSVLPLRGMGTRAWQRLAAWMSHHRTYRWLVASGLGAVVAYLCGGIPLLTVYGLVFLLGRGLAHAFRTSRTAAGAMGMGCALLPVALVRPLGETVSLSTIDVRTAFALLDAPWGLPAAVGMVILRHALPTLGLVLGLAPALAHAPSASTGFFAASLAAALTAQALLAAAMLAVRGTDPVLGSLALGAYVHVASELLYAFGGTALALWLSFRPQKDLR